MSVERTAAALLEDTISLQRDEWRRQIQELLEAEGAGVATVVTMGECEHTGAVVHEVIETNE